MSETQTAYDLAYLLARDLSPDAPPALLAQAAYDRLKWPYLRGLPEATKIEKLNADLETKRNYYIDQEYARITREILDSGEIVTGHVARERAVLAASRARPWLWPGPANPTIARAADTDTSAARASIAGLVRQILGDPKMSEGDAIRFAFAHRGLVKEALAAARAGDGRGVRRVRTVARSIRRRTNGGAR